MLALVEEWKNVIGWLCVATYAKYVLRWSLKDILHAMFKEASDALHLRPSKAAINAYFFTGLVLVVLVLIALPSFSKFSSFVQNMNLEHLNPNIAFMGVTLLGVTSLLGVLKERR